MTEDTSPENLRKFLESDDPAMVQMGLSLAEGSGVSNEMLVEILWMYMMHDDKTIRAAAKSTFMKIAPEDAKLAVKKNWKASYRTEWANHWKASSGKKHFLFNKRRIGILGKALHQTSVCLVERLIKEWEGGNTGAVETLRIIGDARAVEPLIKALSDGGQAVRESAARALGEIGDKRAVKPLIKALEDSASVLQSSSYTFTVSYNTKDGREAIKEALKKLGHEVK